MVDRIQIEPGILKLSIPGVAVTAATENQLLFNGTQAGAAKFLKGSIDGTRNGNGVTNHTVMYGKTYTAKPFIMVNMIGRLPQWTVGSVFGSSYPGEAFCIRNYGDAKNPFNNFQFNWSRLEVEVLLDRVNFAFSSAASGCNYTIDYLIYDYRTGF